MENRQPLEPAPLCCPGVTEFPNLGLRVTCREADTLCNNENTFTVHPEGTLILRGRRSGDALKLSGGTKSLKKLFIDRKIPAQERDFIPVLADDAGVLGVYGVGTNGSRAARVLPAITICVEPLRKK
jgi:tRNA(Ile)-lysidine synthase